MTPETPIPTADRDAMHRVIAASGLMGDPARFEVTGPEPRPGTLHPFPRALAADFPLPVAMLVLGVAGGTATVCPVVVPPGRDPDVLAGDRWLPSDESPFRVLPGTGVMQVRTAWSSTLPCAALEPAVRQVDLDALVEEPPTRGRRGDAPEAAAGWHRIWIAVIGAMGG